MHILAQALQDLHEYGTSATIGIEDSRPCALEYSYNAPWLRDGRSLSFRPTMHGVLTGVVTDANDGKPIAGAKIRLAGGWRALLTGEDGSFHIQVPDDLYSVQAVKDHYGTFHRSWVSVGWNHVTRLDIALTTGRVAADADEMTLVMPPESQRSGRFTLTNDGGDTPFTVVGDPTQTWLSAAPATGTLTTGTSTAVTVNASSTGMRPGTVRTGRLVVRSDSGREPEPEIEVKVVVPEE